MDTLQEKFGEKALPISVEVKNFIKEHGEKKIRRIHCISGLPGNERYYWIGY